MKSRLPLAHALAEAGRMASLGVQALGEMLTRPFEGRLWIREMEQIGVRSLGVAAIATIFTGMVLALQTAYSLPASGSSTTSAPSFRSPSFESWAPS